MVLPPRNRLRRWNRPRSGLRARLAGSVRPGAADGSRHHRRRCPCRFPGAGASGRRRSAGRRRDADRPRTRPGNRRGAAFAVVSGPGRSVRSGRPGSGTPRASGHRVWRWTRRPLRIRGFGLRRGGRRRPLFLTGGPARAATGSKPGAGRRMAEARSSGMITAARGARALAQRASALSMVETVRPFAAARPGEPRPPCARWDPGTRPLAAPDLSRSEQVEIRGGAR